MLYLKQTLITYNRVEVRELDFSRDISKRIDTNTDNTYH